MRTSHLNESGIDLDLLKTFLEGSIQESKAILEVTSEILTRHDRLEKHLLIANAELFLVLFCR